MASGTAIPDLGNIKVKATDESGEQRMLHGHITEVAKPLLSAAEVSSRWDSYLFEDGGVLLERNSPIAQEVRAVLARHDVWNQHGIRLYREGNLYNMYVKAGDLVPMLAPVEAAGDFPRPVKP